jgi:PfaB family protein
MLAVREHWGIGRSSGHAGNPLWSNYLVMAGPEKVLPILEKEPHVYLTHVNAPRQVVIGGDPQGCQRVLDELCASTIQAPFDYALHCEVMRSEFDALAYLHDWPVEKDPGLRMYSAAGYDTLRLEQDVIAQSMAEMLTSPLDFPRLVNRVYDDGARVFIEAGAGGNCARWVSETLKGRPHLSISLNRRGADDYSTLVRGLARLYSHRVALDLSPLYASGSRDLRTLAAAVQMDEKAR